MTAMVNTVEIKFLYLHNWLMIIILIKVGMYSDKAAEFQDDRLFDLVAMGVQNVWICEVGSKATDANFEEFQNRLILSKVKG